MSATETKTQTWWRVSGEKIEPREVIKVTPKQVVYLEPHWKAGNPPQERRGGRDTSWETWFETKAAAVRHVREKLEYRERKAREDAAIFARRLAAFNAEHPED